MTFGDIVYAIAVATGAAVMLKFVLALLWGIYARLLRGGKDLKKKYGKWGEIYNMLLKS